MLAVGAVISAAFLMLFWLGFTVGFDQAAANPDDRQAGRGGRRS